MAKQKTALLGGTFDPIHLGHTTVAGTARQFIGAEKLIFVPARRSPLKNLFPKASDQDRLKMIALAIAGNEHFDVNDYELRKSEPCYTLETVRYLKNHYGESYEIYWLIGADTIDELPHWYKITELIDECNLCTMYRACFGRPDFSLYEKIWGPQRSEKLQQNIIETPLVDISSTEIRKRLAGGEDIAGMVCPAVADYINKRALYK